MLTALHLSRSQAAVIILAIMAALVTVLAVLAARSGMSLHTAAMHYYESPLMHYYE